MAADRTRTFGKRAPDGAWEIDILGDIGFFGVDGAELIRELAAVKPATVKFLIHSPGGAVYDAIAVAGYIQDKGITCYAEIYGTCMSAATVFAALAGPKRTAMAAGSMFLVHMPYGGDSKAIDNAAEYLADLYSKSYGWTKGQARKHMEAENGEGVLWTADEAKEIGVVDEVMKISVAAYHKQKYTAMAETKKLKVQATLHLTTMEAVRGAFSSEGTKVEVEVDIDKATADALDAAEQKVKDAEAERDELKTKVDELEQAAQAGSGNEEAITNAQQEATQAKADLAAANSAHEAAIAKMKTDHEAAIAALKAPVGKHTIPDNQSPAVGSMPGNEQEDPNVLALRGALKGSTPNKKN